MTSLRCNGSVEGVYGCVGVVQSLLYLGQSLLCIAQIHGPHSHTMRSFCPGLVGFVEPDPGRGVGTSPRRTSLV